MYCSDPVIDDLGTHDFDGTDNSYASLDTDVMFDNEFSFAGWVRVDSWTGSCNRVFDFGTNATQGMRLHRNDYISKSN